MTNSNRALNRLIIALIALALIVIAAWMLNRVTGLVAIDALGEPDKTALWIAAGASLALLVASISWIATRGRGHTRTLLAANDEEGTGTIEARVAADLISEDLSRVPDIVDVSARAFLVRGQATLELTVTTRRAADVRLVVDSVGRAVSALDRTLDSRIPVLLHVASGVRANLAREQRVR